MCMGVLLEYMCTAYIKCLIEAEGFPDWHYEQL